MELKGLRTCGGTYHSREGGSHRQNVPQRDPGRVPRDDLPLVSPAFLVTPRSRRLRSPASEARVTCPAQRPPIGLQPATMAVMPGDFDGTTCHIPVMVPETLAVLRLAPGAIVVDGTLGGAGHTRALAHVVGPAGRVLALDRDPAAVERGNRRCAGLPVTCIQANFQYLPEVLESQGLTQVDGLVLDLGLSSDQLADGDRGFSFQHDAPLDMRFNPEHGRTAADLVMRLSERELADVIFQWGEDRYARRIARGIVYARERQRIKTTAQLADIVRQSVPRRGFDRIHPATRTFQALRIAVNDELASLSRLFEVLPMCVREGGRVAIISFHSLEDRLVKTAFKDERQFAMITRKPLRPAQEEVRTNRRARSARLRAAALGDAGTVDTQWKLE